MRGLLPPPEPFARDRQIEKFGPTFARLADVMARPGALELTTDPAALAPERLLIFEVRGLIQEFTKAVKEIPGLDFIDEEELDGDEDDKNPVAYLLVPDARALLQILSRWKIWEAKQLTPNNPWTKIFDLLRDLRVWGPNERLSPDERKILSSEIEDRSDDEAIILEIEIVFSSNHSQSNRRQDFISAFIRDAGGQILDSSRIEDINYHAILASLSVKEVRKILKDSSDTIRKLDFVWHIRPQSISSSIDVADPISETLRLEQPPERQPILALLDGVPIARHPLLSDRIEIADVFGLESDTPTDCRVHGTAMASLIIHGDRNRLEAPLRRPILSVPVMGWDGGNEGFPENRLIIDVIYEALLAIHGNDALGPNVLIVNMSLGNPRRPFHGQMSPWARLLDRIAWRFGVLFVVSAGNVRTGFSVDFTTSIEFEEADGDTRAVRVVKAVHRKMAERNLISPAETLNGLTVGAANIDAVPPDQRRTVSINVEPYPKHRMANPSSGLGPGFARSVKPDILMPGSREHLRVMGSGGGDVSVAVAGVNRAFGLKVAAPPTGGNENTERYTNGTSAAAALASRTCHRIHDALEEAYGDQFLNLSRHSRAVLLKALMAHPARWPEETAALIREAVGPFDPRQYVRQKDNIRRFLGYGVLDADDAVACAADRATFWAVGTLAREQSDVIEVPVPVCFGGKARVHGLSATLAWFTPVQTGRKSYRSVKLNLLEPNGLDILAMKASTVQQPDQNQIRRGTLLSRHWQGNRAPAVTADMSIRLVVQRELDQGTPIDDPVPYGLAVTLSMPGVNEVYDQVRQRLGLRQRV